jgi:hypothetical protein
MNRQVHAALLIALLAVSRGAMAMEDLPDPTRPSGAGVGDATPRGGEFVLHSTVVSPGRVFAIVNGERVATGSRIRGAEVIAIRPYEVVLRRDGREIVVRLMPRLAIEPNTNGSKP